MPAQFSLRIDELVLQGVTLAPHEAVQFERSLIRTLDELLAQNPDWGEPRGVDRVALTLDRSGPGHSSSPFGCAEALGASVGRTLAGHVFHPSSGEAPC